MRTAAGRAYGITQISLGQVAVLKPPRTTEKIVNMCVVLRSMRKEVTAVDSEDKTYHLPVDAKGFDGEQYTIHSRLYETARGKELAIQSASGSDLFALIDQLSLQLRQDLGVGEHRIEGTIDLPVSERLTASVPAFRQAMRGVHAFWRNDIFSARSPRTFLR